MLTSLLTGISNFPKVTGHCIVNDNESVIVTKLLYSKVISYSSLWFYILLMFTADANLSLETNLE
jgi:hypothetical protein